MATTETVKKPAPRTFPGRASYMVVELSYNHKLIFDRETGSQFLEAYSQAMPVKSEYNEPDRLMDKLPDIKIGFLTEDGLRMLLAGKLIDP